MVGATRTCSSTIALMLAWSVVMSMEALRIRPFSIVRGCGVPWLDEGSGRPSGVAVGCSSGVLLPIEYMSTDLHEAQILGLSRLVAR